MAYMRRLVRAAPQPRKRRRGRESVSSGLRHLLERWTAEPAVVIGRYRDALAANPLAQAMNPGFVPGRSLLQHTFLNHEGRDFYINCHRCSSMLVVATAMSMATPSQWLCGVSRATDVSCSIGSTHREGRACSLCLESYTEVIAVMRPSVSSPER
jgi:hypothetical protein